ncbi:alcohol dehydrogenase GroES-like domain-containing protein [Marssonina coronariae]|uniref:Alcohol dehydrogenase GroES-like domain-containing protein n=1 Tax=Diplocarpon coronariae TaxID=2795749 RepID=A0A218YYF3_9HELO|nr:alcohol dehydrogenase GroES-like domain-containing protein [Marssonina coronariae]
MAPMADEPTPLTVIATAHSPHLLPSKPTQVLASVLHGPHEVKLEKRSLEEPALGELQIQIKATGICGSDVSYYKKFANGDLCACAPLSLGYESSGVVVGIGPQVNGFTVGDRVVLEVGIPCGQCTICRKGRYNLCGKTRFRSSAKSVPHFQGTLQERINHPRAVVPQVCLCLIPDHVSFDAAALLEPLSVAIHSLNRAAPAPGSTALVIGAGTVGLLVAAMARQSGCTFVTIMGVDAGRADYAVSNGFATHGYVVSRPFHTSVPFSCSSIYTSGTSTPASEVGDSYHGLDGAKAAAADVLAVTRLDLEDGYEDEDEGVDVTFECTGKEVCMQTSLYVTKSGGSVIMVGMGTPIQTVPLSAAHLREVDILGIFRYANTYPAGILLLAGRQLPSRDGMVTHRSHGLAEADNALALAVRTADDEGKPVIEVVVEA